MSTASDTGLSGDQQTQEQPLALPDPTVRLAVAMYHGKGAYALLIGSGVSRSAGIPTGWEIVLDLIRQVAVAHGEPCEPGKEDEWYRDRFDVEPTYDGLLGQVTGLRAEGAQLLGTYIEPTPEDVAARRKVPQEAHRAIARMVRDGYVRVIVTTNFDHLLEGALRAAGVVPRVIATTEAVEQALPLVHQQCTIIKVHGDYTSGELKNTTDELAVYDAPMNRLLERVFSDFGLIVCGWSADWDTALRAVLGENASRAYSTFWAVRGELGDAANNVIASRKGKAVIEIDGADEFFQTLEEKVDAIRETLESPALTADVARATAERYLEDPHAYRIRIHKLLMNETDRVVQWLSTTGHIYLPSTPPPATRATEQVLELHNVLQPLLAMFVVTARWGAHEQQRTLTEVIERVMDSSAGRDRDLRWLGYWGYTTYLLLYAGGIAAISSGYYEMLRALLEGPTAENGDRRQRVPLIWALSNDSRYPAQNKQVWLDSSGPTPLSDQLHDNLRQPLATLLPSATRYDENFDRFEYFFALVYRDIANRGGDNKTWAPVGRFSRQPWGSDHTIMADVDREVNEQRDAWPPLRAGLFGGDFDRFEEVRKVVNGFVQQVRIADHLP